MEKDNKANTLLVEFLLASVLRTACQELFWDMWLKMRKATEAVERTKHKGNMRH